MFYQSVYHFYDDARKRLGPITGTRSKRRGARYRLKTWRHHTRLIKWVLQEYFPENEGGRLWDSVAVFLVRVGKCWVYGGVHQALAFVKSTRNSLLFSLSTTDKKASYQARRKARRAFGSRVQVDRLHGESDVLVRFLLTVLTLMRGVKVKPILDVRAITDPCSGTVRGRWGRYVAGFWRSLASLTSETSAPVYWRKFHLSVKKGPSAQHAVTSWLTDFLSMPKSLKEAVSVLGGESLRDIMVFMDWRREELIQMFQPKISGVYRRIEAIADSEGKSRVIAILDYWSQTALKPLHTYLFRILEKIPQDVTFDQGSFVGKTQKWSDRGEWYSVDLSKATDRFPIKLISLVLKGRFSSEYVRAWEQVMVGYPFSSRGGPSVSYSVGNPMGAYSSWASFALAHHFVMYRVARELGRPWETLPYVVLGDDVLIGSPQVGERYMSIIKELGVEVSLEKTYVSSEMCEFAKRYLRKGREITPFPISAISGDVEVCSLVSSLLGETRKGLVPKDGIPIAVRRLIQTCYPKLSEHSLKEVEIQAFHCEAATRFFSGVITASEFLTLLCNHHSGIEVSNLTGNTLIQTALVDILTESLKADEGSFILEFEKVEAICSQPTAPVRMILLRECVPVLALGPWIDEHSRKMEKDLGRVTWSREEWKELLKVVYNPFGKYSYDSTPDRVRARVSHRLGAKVRSYFEDPLLLTAVNSRRKDRPFARAGLLLCYRGKETEPYFDELLEMEEEGMDPNDLRPSLTRMRNPRK